jgi:hypothetical protein
VHMFMTRDTIMDDYYIDRVGSRRFHLRVNPHENGPELIVFDGLQWARTNGKAPWRSSPALDLRGIVPSIADLFAQGLSHPVEQATPNGGRSIEGTIAWANGGSCEGKLLLRIDSSGLPSLLHYDGLCDGKALRFH